MRQTSGKHPKKLFYRIQEVSEITGIKPHVLRYWETEFPPLKPQKGPNDQRRYRQSDIELVLKIKTLLYDQRFTIAGARQQMVGSGGNGKSAGSAPEPPKRSRKKPERRLNGITRRLGTIRKEVRELQAILTN